LLIACCLPGAEAVEFRVTYEDFPNQGFNDPTLGQQRRTAFEYAAGIWAGRLRGEGTIDIVAVFELDFSGFLAAAGPIYFDADFSGAPLANTWYTGAQVIALTGSDPAPSEPEIVVFCNSLWDDEPLLPSFYYGLDARPPQNTYDFVTIILHELAHGLGFLDTIDEDNGGWLLENMPDIYSRQLTYRGVGNIDSLTNNQRLTALTSDSLYWKGLTVVGERGAQVQMYAPSNFSPGSSISHWDQDNSPDLLMEPAYNRAAHDLDLTDEALEDLGYETGPPPTPTPTFTRTPTRTPTPTPTPTFSPTFTPTPTITNTPRYSLSVARHSTLDNPVFVTLGDLTGDGFDEIVTAHYAEGQVGILINDGAGNFPGSPTILGTGEGLKPTHITIGDQDNDLDNDLVVVVLDSDRVLVFLNNGNGTFAEPPSELPIPVSRPISAFLGDLSGDGAIDLAVANSEGDDLTLVLNQTSAKGLLDGANQVSRVPTGGQLPTYIKGGFLDPGNLLIDFAIPNFESQTVTVLLGLGNGTYESPQEYDVPVNPRQIGLEDMNGDGHLDLVVACEGAPQFQPPEPGSVSILLNDGTGHFVNGGSYVVGQGPVDAVGFDFDGDGDRDVGLALEGLPASHADPPLPGSLSVFYNDQGVLEDFDTFRGVGDRPLSLAVGSLNDSVRNDLVVANQEGSEIGILMGTERAQDARIGDIDRDGERNFTDLFAMAVVYSRRDPIFRDAGDLDGDDLLGASDVLSFLQAKRSSNPLPKKLSLVSGEGIQPSSRKIPGAGDRNGDGVTDYRDVVRGLGGE
jgi:hypothetical protein